MGYTPNAYESGKFLKWPLNSNLPGHVVRGHIFQTETLVWTSTLDVVAGICQKAKVQAHRNIGYTNTDP